MAKERKPYDQGKVLKLWESGKSIKDIAEAMKMSRVYAHRVLTTKYKAQYQAGVKARQEAREKAKGAK
jgi:DNA-binding CsgD family transcriptional regulator